MAQPHWALALLAASLAGLLLADAALGQTFTYSRGWKPGGKRSRVASLAPPPPLPPRFRALGAALPPSGAFLDDAAGLPDDQAPVRFVVEGLSERWAPYEGPSWRPQPQDHGQDKRHDADRDSELYRHGELSTQGDHDDH
ncbi:uncharacterized protein LOC117653537 [Thrips palmi]|uniref:Uncharacterized protein LOC117653537 n=1 Tax=Thrips palmi TaxID=161013 RepID=A0A6P9ACU8_THRPL|nr:uncharacterized protein LOC117653537 [Thrips palmi]